MKLFRALAVIALIIWMVFIYSLSADTAPQSNAKSGRIVTAVVKILYPDFDEMSQDRQTEITDKISFAIRKLAHFTIYAVLGALSFLSFITYNKIPIKIRYLIILAVGLLCSASDEYHQTFIYGRSGEIRDIVIDFSGVLLAVIIFGLMSKHKIIKKYIE